MTKKKIDRPPIVLELIAWKPGLMLMLPLAVAQAIDPVFAKQAQEIVDAAIYRMMSGKGLVDD